MHLAAVRFPASGILERTTTTAAPSRFRPSRSRPKTSRSPSTSSGTSSPSSRSRSPSFSSSASGSSQTRIIKLKEIGKTAQQLKVWVGPYGNCLHLIEVVLKRTTKDSSISVFYITPISPYPILCAFKQFKKQKHFTLFA